jgi:hypothetical protein
VAGPNPLEGLGDYARRAYTSPYVMAAIGDQPRRVTIRRLEANLAAAKRDGEPATSEDFLRAVEWLGLLYVLDDRARAAARPLEFAVRQRQRLLGADDAHVRDLRAKLAHAYELGGRPVRALDRLEARAAAAEAGGPASKAALKHRMRLSDAYRRAGRVEAAFALHRDALAAAERDHGRDGEDAAVIRAVLAGEYLDADRPEAVDLYDAQVATLARIGARPAAIAEARARLAAAHLMTGRPAEAQAAVRQGLADLRDLSDAEAKLVRRMLTDQLAEVVRLTEDQRAARGA